MGSHYAKPECEILGAQNQKKNIWLVLFVVEPECTTHGIKRETGKKNVQLVTSCPLTQVWKKISGLMLVVENRCLKAHGKYKLRYHMRADVEI